MSSMLRLRAAARRPGSARRGVLVLALALAASGVAGQHAAPGQLCDAAQATLVDATSEAEPERRGDDSKSAAGGTDNATPAALGHPDLGDDSPPLPLWLASRDGCRAGHPARIDRPPDLA